MNDPNTPSSETTPKNIPSYVNDAQLVGIHSNGAPVYFNEKEERTFEAKQADDSWEEGEQHHSGPIEEAIASIGDAIGWDRLSEFGEQNHDDDSQ